jgi:hypothetical protein
VNGFEVVVRRVRGSEWVEGQYVDMAAAYQARSALVAKYRAVGFIGGRNAAGVYRLSARREGVRVRLAVYVRPAQAVAYLN